MNEITFNLEDDEREKIDFNGEAMTFSFLFINI